jgi:hypothetical protein
LVDKSESGRNTIALSNFAAAVSGGVVGMSYLPPGYNDITHAGQRMVMQMGTLALKNVAVEFEPQWGPLVQKLRIPKLIPEWWTKERN